MRSLSMTKKACALLFVFTAFGAVLGTSAPADAQTPPTFVTWLQRNRTISFTSNFATCNRYISTPTSIQVPRGEWRALQQAWATCGDPATKMIVGNLITFAAFDAGGYTTAADVLTVRVDTPTGSTTCGEHWEESHIRETINAPITQFWVGPVQSSENPVDPFIYLNCGPHGTVGIYYSFSEGLRTF
jgi:hypothetical protein